MDHAYLTTGEVAQVASERLSVDIPVWQVRRIFDNGTLPEPPRFAGKRAIPATDLETVIGVLRRWREE